MKFMNVIKTVVMMLVVVFGMTASAYAQCNGMRRMRGHHHRMSMHSHSHHGTHHRRHHRP